jgi:dienelactone hydrolase
MAHDVFISYSHKDKNVTDAVCSILEQNKVRCWIAPRDITPGIPFAEAIIDGIKDSKVFILVYSSNSNHSPQVVKEVDRAVHHGLAIIPLRLEDVPMSKQLEYYVSDVHWLDALTPPLEKHINKLLKVVQMLLTMDEVDSEDIEEALKSETVKQEETGKPETGFKLRKVLIPVLLVIILGVTVGAVYLFKRQAKIHWAREEAIPEIERLIEENDVWRNLVEPYQLALRAEKILGSDPDLAELISRISLETNILTSPPGAKVYMKEYMDADAEWNFLGETPLEKIRVPIGIYRWRLEKEGYDTVLAAASTWKMVSLNFAGNAGAGIADTLIRNLDKVGSIPPGMVRIPAKGILNIRDDFFIGRYEVTNREYKTFVDAGGYQNREYWKHPFVKNGKELPWEKAMSELVDQSGQQGPSIWLGGDYPEGEDDYPVSGVCWYEAAAYAEFVGMSLPTSSHWAVAAGMFTPMVQVRQLGGFAILAPFCNFNQHGTVAVGSLSGITAYGAYDMAGNVREWCWNRTLTGRVIRGGSWQDNTYEFGNVRQAPAMDRSPRNGIRLAFYPDPDSIPEELFAPLQSPEAFDISKHQPVSDNIFQIYKELFAYDKSELNSNVEYREESQGGWVLEKVSFDAAYGGERVQAYLFLPLNVKPPFQTVIYFPGSAAAMMSSSQDMESYYEFTMFLNFIVRNGRAVLFPIYKGTFERGKPELTAIHTGADSYAYNEFLIQLVKDCRRSIDYLETRPDIDSSKMAYYGMSWGGYTGIIITALEERLTASILLAGSLGVEGVKLKPEVDPINYVTRVRIPTLMLNGKYDTGIDDFIRPALDLLGTPSEDKDLILYDTDHIPPRAEYIKEILAWLDKYLGPVR